MITKEQQEVARKLMEQHGYEDIEFRDNGDVMAVKGDQSVLVANTNGVEFELDYGRYVVEDTEGYRSMGYISLDDARREAASLAEATGGDYRVVDLAE